MSYFPDIAYLVAATLFILSIKSLASPKTARKGNIFGMVGMAIAIATTFYYHTHTGNYKIIPVILLGAVIGGLIAMKIRMTAIPQLIAGLHSLIGMAAVMIAASAMYAPELFAIGEVGNITLSSMIELGLGGIIGGITFSGSVIAFTKLQGFVGGKPWQFRGQQILNILVFFAIIYFFIAFCLSGSEKAFWAFTILACILGVLLIVPIGGADMPVVISMLNSYSGWAAVGIGFTINNSLLIVTGALVGTSGAILSYVMCKGMNRSLINVFFGKKKQHDKESKSDNKNQNLTAINRANSEDAAYMLENAESVIIVPGYGMAVARAQHALKEMVDILSNKGIKVRYAIHPVAGRMPGHMNVLLAEANVPYDQVYELQEINRDFAKTDIAFVIGANDITNPAAKKDSKSPIYGMPVFDVEKAGKVLFLKRTMATGYAGVENELFFRENTFMTFGDAKKSVELMIKKLTNQ